MKNNLYLSKLQKKLFTLILLVSVLSLYSIGVSAQDRMVKGTVIDEKKEPVIGATVIITGTSNMAVTNLDGQFSVYAPNNAKTIEISYVGYKTEILPLRGKNVFNIQMKEDHLALEEVVVIGYGTAKKGNLTGSIAKADASKIEDRPATNIASALQGQLSGVEISSSTGAPGEELTIRVRGAASINADATPLYVVDGIPTDNLGSINPNDIQSIEVLKDASSSAIYGSRGANGVILITTKTASTTDKVSIQFSAAFSMQQIEKKVDILSPEEWIQFRTRYNDGRYMKQYAGQGATINDDWETRLAMNNNRVNYYMMNDPRWTQPNYGGLAMIDWQDEFFRLAPMQNYQLSISGGSDNTKYRVSLGYIDQQGIAIETHYKRLNIRSNIEAKLFKKLKVGINIAPTISWNDGGRIDGKDQQANRALTMVPIAEPEAGLNAGAEPYARYNWAGNFISPIAYMKQTTNHAESMYLSSSAYVKAELIDGLQATATASYSFIGNQNRSFTPSSVTSRWTDGEGYQTTGNRSDSRTHKYLLQVVMNYDKKFGKHTVSGMVGYSMESSNGSSSRISAKQFPDNSLEIFNESDMAIQIANANMTTPIRLLSYFGRAQYEFDNRYLLTASIRQDGSSRFGKNNRWGIFPAISAAYRISNEKFWPERFVMNQLKLRASWGLNGNNSIPSNAALGIISSANYSVGGGMTNGFAPSSINNENLGWEKTRSWNFGIDIGFFNSRISISADYYNKTTKDLLYQVSIPASMGFSKAWGNIGSINNKGFELELTTQNLTGTFKWSTSFNMSYNKNKVISLGEDNSTVFTGWSDSNTQAFMVGQPLKVYYMYDAVGVYQYREDLKKYPKMENTVLGDVRYRDTNDDGIINDNDRTLVGKPSPDYTFGMTNTFKYKNFDLSFLLTGQTGGKIFSLLGRSFDRPGMGASINVLSHWKNMWISEDEPGDGKTPGIDNANTGTFYDTRWLYSTDFIKLKNVTLTYRIPVKKGRRIRNARVYISGENLFMLDKYDGGFSPEANNGGASANYDYGSYPQARIFTLGGSITF